MTNVKHNAKAQFRALHEARNTFVIPNPWDVGTARILASLGFKALATTSAGMCFGLGINEGTATREQFLEHCRMLVNATDLPVSADLEKGFGDSPESVAETIRDAAATGLAGGSIEDYSGDSDNPIFDFDLAVERVAAAVEACRSLSDDFVFTARAENLCYGRNDLDDTIRRLQAFETVGADVLYAPGLRDLEAIRTVCASVTKPVNVVMGLSKTTFSVDELRDAGVARISVGAALARAAFGEFVRAAREIADAQTFTYTERAISFAEMEGLLTPDDS
ncbi:MAG: isocitrate lyase/phosphoenolpyruvate mutase family protein [Pseudomonadota bacterium]